MILYILVVLAAIVGLFIPHVFIVAGIFLIITIITQSVHLYNHEFQINCVWESRMDMEIQRRKCDELLNEFKLYLAEMYPAIEKEIIKSMTPEKVTAYMIKYPELKSSETICKLVDLINKNKSKFYEYEVGITRYIKLIKSRMYSAKLCVLTTKKMKNDLAETLKLYESK